MKIASVVGRRSSVVGRRSSVVGEAGGEEVDGAGDVVGQVVAGCVSQVGEQAFNIGRTAWLAAGLPQLHIGYDPCYGEALDELRRTRDFAAFVAAAVAAAPRAELVYIAYPVVLEAEAAGFDLVGAFHAAGRRLDAYTIARADAEGAAIAERLLALRVDQITTDDPEGVVAALG